MDIKTIFCDIDGTLIETLGDICCHGTQQPVLLKNTLNYIREWGKLGYYIVITTGRKESLRKVTEEQLTIMPVLCADTEVVLDNIILGKPRDIEYPHL